MKRTIALWVSIWLASTAANAQITWSSETTALEGGYPRLAQLSDGSLLLGVDFNGIRVYKSTDKGDTWSFPTSGAPAVADPASENEHVGNVFPLELANGDILIAHRHLNDTDTYDTTPDGIEFFNISIQKSSDGGVTWSYLSSPVKHPSSPGGGTDSNDGAWEPFLYQPSSNEVWCIYARQNSGRDDPPLYILMKRSTDNGATWGPEETIIGNTQIGISTAGMPGLVKAANGDLVVVAEIKSPTSNLFAIGMVRSTDNGASWGAMTIIHEATPITDGYGAGAPYIVKLDDGTLLVSFQHGGLNTEANSQMGYITSSDNGATWSGNTDLFDAVSMWNGLFVDADGILFGMTSGVKYKRHYPAGAPPASSTVAYWRFEEGVNGVEHPGDWDNFYQDSSGNGNHMSSWWDGVRPAGTTDRPFTTVPQTGAANDLALDYDTDDEIGTFAPPSKMLNSYAFTNGWTIETSFKLKSLDIHQGIIAKEGNGVVGEAPFWMKILPWNNHVEVLFFDDSNNMRILQSLAPVTTGEWYSVAATYDNADAKLYLKREGDTDYALQNSLAFADGANLAGYDNFWTIGRMTWSGNPVDYMHGTVDEARISNIALAPGSFIADMGAPPPAIGNIAMELLPSSSELALTWTTSELYSYALLKATTLSNPTTWSTNQSGIPGGASSVTVTASVDVVQAFYKAVSE